MHWTFRDDKTKIPQPDEYFGFVYVITNKLTTKQYIGCKQYWQMRKKKKHKPSSWRVYTSSSKYLNEDIDKIGKRRFKFEIIQEYKTKRGLLYYEQYYQMKYHVLTAVIEGTDEPAYYNKNIGGVRFYVPLEVYEDPEFRKKMSASVKANWADPDSVYNTPEYRKKISENAKAMWADPELRKKKSASAKAMWADPELRKKISASVKAQWTDPEYRKKRSASAKAQWTDPEFRKKQIEDAKARWTDPEFRKNQTKSRADPEYKKKMSASLSEGPYRITFDTGREITIDSLNRWAKENGYDQAALSRVLSKKRSTTKHKDIVKVERLTDDPNEE